MAGFNRHGERGLTAIAIGGGHRRQAKLFKALELLSTGISVSEISDQLGFEEPSPFIAMFKAAFGVSPARYRKEVKSGAF